MVGGSCRNDVNIWEWEYDDSNEMRKMGPEESRGGAELATRHGITSE